LDGLGATVNDAWDLGLPASVVDETGRVVWLNEAAEELFGDILGKSFLRSVAPDFVNYARDQLSKRLVGTADGSDFVIEILARDGGRVSLHVSCVALHRGTHVVGSLAVFWGQSHEPPRHPVVNRLTPRQGEVLRYLQQGLSTRDMANVMQLSRETVRNHVRALLHVLGVRSRLEAVLLAQRAGDAG
jgi:DNA-binding CsgD family transcriptional regulator